MNEGRSFLKGGAGCFVVFIVLALVAVVLGGSAHLDLVGVVLLFLIGGVVGLAVNWIYQKGRRSGSRRDDDP